MELETVLYRVEGNVAIISLNRTKAMNSLNKQIFADLTTAFEAAKADDAVRVVIMNGEGRAFCAGGAAQSRCRWPGRPPPRWRPCRAGRNSVFSSSCAFMSSL